VADPALKLEDYFTYGQYKHWPEDDRWELIHGKAWAMSAPSAAHQRLLLKLLRLFADFLDDKPCEVLPAPFDILLPKGDEEEDAVDTVIQPDIVVFCDPAKVRNRYGWGAPDLAVEILSPSTAKKDLNEKFDLFEAHGVREYWVFDPFARSVWVYRRTQEGHFDRGELRESPQDLEPIASKVLEGFSVDPAAIFAGLT